MAAVLLGPPEDSTDADAIRIVWRAPAQCPDESAVREQVRARLDGPGIPVEVEGTISEVAEHGWQLTMSIRGPHGVDERTVEAAACEELAEAAGLLIAVAADPRHGAGEPGEPAPVSEPASVSEPEQPDPPAILPMVSADDRPAEPTEPTALPLDIEPRTEPPPEETSSARARERRIVVRLEGMVQLLRLLPEPVGGGVGGAVGLRRGRPWLRLEARAHYVFSQRAMYSDVLIGGDFDLWTVGAAVCLEPRVSVLTVPICTGVELGGLRGQSFGVTEPSSGTSLWAGLPLDLALRWEVRPWLALWAGPRALVSLSRPRFHVRDLDELFRAGPAALRAVVGLEFQFP